MSGRVDCTERDYNQWCSVRPGNCKLRKSQSHGGWRAKENNIRNLMRLELFYHRMLEYTYIDADTKTEQEGLCLVLFSLPRVKSQSHKK